MSGWICSLEVDGAYSCKSVFIQYSKDEEGMPLIDLVNDSAYDDDTWWCNAQRTMVYD
jgi:hypothetical protein